MLTRRTARQNYFRGMDKPFSTEAWERSREPMTLYHMKFAAIAVCAKEA
jgi:hypothetical protein